jgi:4'-phosphopantetheinyl transferase EntD
MLAKLLPAQVAAIDTTADQVDAALFPEEEALIRNAVQKRRHEFATARWCARRAMVSLGLPASPVLPGRRGAPQWASSVVGSMTHCAGYRAAALARTSDFSAIGIDAEPNEALPEDLLESIALPQEVHWVRQLLASAPGVAWDRLLFSIKESVYKAWFPLTWRELDFEDALITVDPVRRTFRARLLLSPAAMAPTDPAGFTGRFSAERGVLISAIAVPAIVPAMAGAGAYGRLPAQQNAPHKALVGSAA